MSSTTSWVDVHPESHFTIHNFPFGIFSTPGSAKRLGSAIGDFVIDLSNLADKGFFKRTNIPSEDFRKNTLNSFIGRGKSQTNQISCMLGLLSMDTGYFKLLPVPLHSVCAEL